MNLAEAVAARRSVRAFQDRAVPRDLVERAVSLAVQAPAPHHSSPWRFALLETPGDKKQLAADMGEAWRDDLNADGLPRDRIEAILSRSEGLLRSTPLLTVCCADMTRSHSYPDDRRRLAEWSLFAHSVGAALQIYMTALAESGVASCWISAPVFCRHQVQGTLSLPAGVEPHALVLVGYASPDYHPRPRPTPDPLAYIL
ncbi:MAG: nitroreductase family protein [Actinobacteria bacterium]|nr:nitroreductase family protein [Actinomycetota bacterium]